MTSPTPLVVLDRVGKHFAGHIAVDDLSLVVPAGVIYGLLGLTAPARRPRSA
jgi:ABC-type uncharacterized transport system ATPase subunit